MNTDLVARLERHSTLQRVRGKEGEVRAQIGLGDGIEAGGDRRRDRLLSLDSDANDGHKKGSEGPCPHDETILDCAAHRQNKCFAKDDRLCLRSREKAMKMVAASDSSLLVVFGNAISPALHERVIALFRALQSRDDARIRNLHPGYASLLIDFDPLRLTHDELMVTVEHLAGTSTFAVEQNDKVVTIPVCYDAEFGPDLPDVAQHAGLSEEEVIRLHTSPAYLVYFLGFSPGFVYLGGLPEVLHTPRLATPRPSIAGGSVGIAGGQTGIYPAGLSRRMEADWTNAAADVRS